MAENKYKKVDQDFNAIFARPKAVSSEAWNYRQIGVGGSMAGRLKAWDWKAPIWLSELPTLLLIDLDKLLMSLFNQQAV